MIAFDTNLVVRLLVADDEVQTARAVEVIEEAADAGERCLLPDAVLCETAWVLTSAYSAPKADVVDAFRALADDGRYGFEDADTVRAAIESYESGKGDFADYVIGHAAARRGARTTYTFDRSLRLANEFTVLR